MIVSNEFGTECRAEEEVDWQEVLPIAGVNPQERGDAAAATAAAGKRDLMVLG